MSTSVYTLCKPEKETYRDTVNFAHIFVVFHFISFFFHLDDNIILKIKKPTMCFDQKSRKRPVDVEKEIYSIVRLRGYRYLKNKE